MIIENETTLSSGEYADLLAQRKDATYRLKAYRWMPEYSEAIPLSASAYNSNFDMVEHDDQLYAVTFDIMKFFDGANWNDVTSVTGFAPPDDLDPDISYSLISGHDGNLYIFGVTSVGVVRNHFDGSVWDGWNELITDGTVTAMAATHAFRFHYVSEDLANFRYELKSVRWTGASWFVESSGIYWPFEVTSFDAVEYNGKDIIVMSTHVPGAISAKYLNNKVVKYALDAGGIVGFTYQNLSWSDHFEIDILDEIKTWRNRENVRLSIVNDRLWMTSFSSDGTQSNSFNFYRSYQSIDGIHWSHGEYFPISSSNQYGIVLGQYDDTAYLMFNDSIQSAKSTLMFQNSHEDNIIDVTDYVLDLSVSRQDMQQINFVLNNETGWIQDTFLNGQATVALTLELGYWVDGEALMVQTGIFEIDAVSNDEQLPEHVVTYSGRDWMAWMTTKYSAEQFKFWIPQTIGGDDYTDNTGTGYGGMAHTATATGSWKTEDNFLILGDSNREGIAYSSFVTDCWNGQFSIGINPSMADNDEIYGLLFRSQDKDNGYLCYYDQENDEFVIAMRRDGNQTSIWTSTTVGIQDSTDKFYMRIEFYYCSIQLFTSEDGITFDPWEPVLLPGFDPSTGIIQSGLVGVIGKGYSTETWSPDPGPIPSPSVPPIPDPIPAWSGTLPAKGVVLNRSEAKVALITGYSLNTMTEEATVTYSDRSGNLAALGVTYCIWGYSDPYNYRRFFLLTDLGILKNDDIDQSSVWTLMQTNTTLFGGAYIPHQAMGSHMVNGWGLIACGSNALAITDDSWATFTTVGIMGSANPATSYFHTGQFCDVSVWICGHDANHLYGMRESSLWVALFKSTDGGLTWTQVLMTDDGDWIASNMVRNNQGQCTVNIPYSKPGGAPNLDDGNLLIEIIAGAYGFPQGNVSVINRLRSTDGGVHVAIVPNDTPVMNGRLCNTISYFTHDSKYQLYPVWNSGYGNLDLAHTDDNVVTISENGDTLSFYSNDLLVAISMNGWINPNVGIAFNQNPNPGVADPRLWITFDQGVTWYRCNLPASWVSTGGVAYAEFSLFTVQ